jgi:outer membrane protein TolC
MNRAAPLLALLGLVLLPFAAAARDVTLADCLRIAIEHNAQIRTASVQSLAAEGTAIKLHAILYPTANAQALSAPTTFYLQINQVFYSRATFPQLRLSRLVREQAVINYRQTVSDVLFQVRQNFYTALGARRNLDLLQNYASSQSRQLASAQQLYQAGKLEKSAVLGVQVSGNLIAQNQNNARLSVSQTLLALDNLLGEELPANAHLVGDLTAKVPARLDPDALTDEALRDRPDLQLLESLRLSQDQQILVDLKNAFPTVGFESNSAFQAPGFGATSNFDLERNYDEPEVERQEGNAQLPLSLYFNWTIFDGGNLAGVRMSDQAQLETQDIAIAALKHSIPGEIAADVAAIRHEQATLDALEAEDAPGEIQHSAQLDFEAGRIRQLDLVNFNADILSQQQARLASEIRLNLAVAALDHALGHGLLTRVEAP